MADAQERAHERKEMVFSWAVVAALSLGVLLWGLVIFWVVGDRKAPAWDFGAVQDVPGESPYSTWTPSSKEFPGTVPHPVVAGPNVEEQHVDGRQPTLPLPGGTLPGAK